jgi:hypothetical protein
MAPHALTGDYSTPPFVVRLRLATYSDLIRFAIQHDLIER